MRARAQSDVRERRLKSAARGDPKTQRLVVVEVASFVGVPRHASKEAVGPLGAPSRPLTFKEHQLAIRLGSSWDTSHISPLASRRIRVARFAAWTSCVTMTIVLPAR